MAVLVLPLFEANSLLHHECRMVLGERIVWRSRNASVGSAAIVGAGPAGLMAAERLAGAGIAVTLFDRMPSPARKFLLAGRGGLNLTHSEPIEVFLARYGPAAPHLAAAIAAFPPAAVRAWCEGLGEPTFTGSSGRVFPRSFKTSPLLRAQLARLADLGVTFAPGHLWTGWDDAGALRFSRPDGSTVTCAPGATLLALGGASWPRLGADGAWTPILNRERVRVTPLEPANCGFEVAWSPAFRARFAGQPLKPIVASIDGNTVRGEAVVTDYGLEGGVIYALGRALRGALARSGAAILTLDLRPDVAADALRRRLDEPRGGQSVSNFLRKAAGLSPLGQNLLREHAPTLPRTPADLASLVKAMPVHITASRGIERAISTAGGVRFDDLDATFMLRAKPGVFVAGEMLDWDAPTGGYLLQAAFSTGVAAAEGMAGWLRRGVAK